MHVGWVTFPGVGNIVSANMSFTHGVTPSVATLTIPPRQGFVALTGDLTFGYDNTTVTFKDCKVDTSSFIRNRSGQVWQLAVVDRRWKWTSLAGGRISGHYNRRNPDGTLIARYTKTPQQLAMLCLSMMGEGAGDVRDLPQDARPEVMWDYDLPAEMLAQLCDDLGCRVILQLDNTVVIRRVGLGADLPTGGTILSDSIAYDLPEVPDEIAIVCGNNLYQADFELEAVGLENDGTIKLVDDLSYAPGNGWSILDFPYMLNITGNDGKNRELAKRTVYRWYRIKITHGATHLPGYADPIRGDRVAPFNGDPLWTLEQLLPVEKEQVATVEENGVAVRLPARVSGIWWRELNAEFINTQATEEPTPVDEENNKAIADRGYALDTALGIVKFAQPIYKNSTPDSAELTIAEAQLRLRTAVSVRNYWKFDWQRYVRKRRLGNLDTPTRYVQKPELVLTHEPFYNANYTVNAVVTNHIVVNPIIDLFLDGIERTYEANRPETKSYPGIKSIDLDGAIHQAVFQVSTRGTTTKLARNDEIVDEFVTTIPYKQMRKLERDRFFAQRLNRIIVSMMKENANP